MSGLSRCGKGFAAAATLAVAASGFSLAPAHANITSNTALSISGGAGIANTPVEVSIVKLSDVLGSQQDNLVVGNTTASSTGTFKVDVADYQTIGYTNGGWVDFETKVMVNGEPRYTFTSKRWDGSFWRDTEGATGTTYKDVDFAAGEPSNLADTDGASMDGVETNDTALARTSGTKVAASTQALASEAPCNWYLDSTGYANTKVGEYHTGYDTTGYFEYGQRADSNISVGYNYGSGWSLSGAKQVSTTNTSYVRWNRVANSHTQLKSKFKYLRYHLTLGPSCTSSSANFGKRWYKSVPYSWYGGTVVGNTIAGPFCTSSANRVGFTRGSSNYRGSARAYTYGGAASAFGASLSATSGFSANVDMSWNFGQGTAAGHYLCGTPDINTSKIVYAR